MATKIDIHALRRDLVRKAVDRGEATATGRTIATDPVTLFRYSVVFNAHRIHYDEPYAMKQGLRDNIRDQRISSFTMRGRAPLFETAPITVQG